MSEQDLKNAVALIRDKKLDEARKILAAILKEDPDNELAWLWSSKCFTDVEKKRYCFQRVLKINPQNPYARKALGLTPSDAIPAASPQEAASSTGGEEAGAKKEVAEEEAGEEGEDGEVVEKPAKPARKPLPLTARLALGIGGGALLILAVWIYILVTPPSYIRTTYSEVKSYLTQIGVFCGTVERADTAAGYGYQMLCSGYSKDGLVQIDVDVYSQKDPKKITMILAYVAQNGSSPAGASMQSVLEYIAGLPYKDAQPAEAQAWVTGNFSQVLRNVPAEEEPRTTFGEILYHLGNLGATRKYLAIGNK
jgi:hypothetical protein